MSASNGIRERIEAAFVTWAYVACRNARKIIVLTLAVTALFATGLPSLEFDNSTDSFLHASDPIRITYDSFRERYGRDERISVTIEGDVFDPGFLEKLRTLHDELDAEVPHVEEMISLVNARSTRGEGDELIVGDLMEEWPETAEELAALRERVLANPLYRNTLISRDASVTLISIELVAFEGDAGEDALDGFDDDANFGDGSKESGELVYLAPQKASEAVNIVDAVVGRHQAPGFELRVAGGPVMTERLNATMTSDMGRFTFFSIVAIGVFLFLLFRRASAVFLPLLVVILALVGTMGLIAMLGGKLSVATQILPSMLLAVGVCDAVHILAIFYQRIAAGDEHFDAIAFTLGHSGLAVLMTSITTAGGFASFAMGSLKPVADLGIYAPFGVVLAFIYTVVLLPALLAVITPKPPSPRSQRASQRVSLVLERIGDFSADHPWSIVIVTTGLIAVSVAGASFLFFSHNPIDWFPEDDSFREATLYMNDRMDGVNVIEIVARADEENAVKAPEFLERLEDVKREASRIHQGEWRIGKTTSIVDIVKEIHQALNENRPDYYVVPNDPELISQELLLFENSGSDDLEDVVDPLYREARITLRVPWMDAMTYPEKLVDIDRRVSGVLGEEIDFEITGLVPMLARTFKAMIHSMARSYIVAILVIAPLMVLLIGSWKRGLLSMIPNLTPVILMLGAMGWSGVKVDGLTMMVGAIVLGLAVDDTIHFMHNFRRYYDRSGDPRAAIHETLHTTGRALLVTSLVLAAGFFVFMGAYMSNIKLFGLLTGGAILVAFISNVVLASSLMMLSTSRRTPPEPTPADPD